jgi:hypothetical protein
VKLWVKQNRKNKDLEKYFRQLNKRVDAVTEALAYESARFVLEEVKSRLPSSGDEGEYARSLELVKVSGVKSGFAIRAKTKRKKVRAIDTTKQVLYVRPKSRRVGRTSPEIVVLARYSPWTASTLPFFPPKNKATVISRKVRRGEYEAIEGDRNKDRNRWTMDLEDLGIKPAKSLEISPRSEVIQDVAFEALRIEFGLGGSRRRSHWRPALKSLANQEIRRMLSPESFVMKPLYSPFSSWSALPKEVKGSITVSEAVKFEGFQKRLR